jgi:hypothetical protein|tara:strand:- start:1326 stop:1568 length:243 start_codon:yes stop_codon:yes gene_type:complete
MGKMSDYAIEQLQKEVGLLEDHGDMVDMYYTQFIEVAFFLKVSASEKMAVAFIKRKLPQLHKEDILFIIDELTKAYREEL